MILMPLSVLYITVTDMSFLVPGIMIGRKGDTVFLQYSAVIVQGGGWLKYSCTNCMGTLIISCWSLTSIKC
jgi:hypothetical protein